jgi:acyl carrier protein
MYSAESHGAFTFLFQGDSHINPKTTSSLVNRLTTKEFRMGEQEMEMRIKRLIVDRLFLDIDAKDIESSKSLVRDYGVDSFNLLELVAGLEEEFDLVIEDSEFSVSNFETVEALTDFVNEKLR